MLFVLGSPLLIEQFHVFMIDAPEAALVAVAVWLILASDRFARGRRRRGCGRRAWAWACVSKEQFVAVHGRPGRRRAGARGRLAQPPWDRGVRDRGARRSALPWYLVNFVAPERVRERRPARTRTCRLAGARRCSRSRISAGTCGRSSTACCSRRWPRSRRSASAAPSRRRCAVRAADAGAAAGAGRPSCSAACSAGWLRDHRHAAPRHALHDAAARLPGGARHGMDPGARAAAATARDGSRWRWPSRPTTLGASVRRRRGGAHPARRSSDRHGRQLRGSRPRSDHDLRRPRLQRVPRRGAATTCSRCSERLQAAPASRARPGTRARRCSAASFDAQGVSLFARFAGLEAPRLYKPAAVGPARPAPCARDAPAAARPRSALIS